MQLRIIGINLLVLIAYWVIALNNAPKDILIVFSLVHVIVNALLMLLSFLTKKSEEGINYLLSIFLILIIGFSSCN